MRLRREVEFAFATMIANIKSYLGNVSAGAGRNFKGSNGVSTGQDLQSAVGGTINAWTVAQSELDRLLNVRIDRLVNGLRYSVLLTGVLGGLSIVLAILTHRHIVTPLERFEAVAKEITESKDYNLRIDQSSDDEIGRLAVAFNGMLSELAAAREREISEQSEAARVLGMTTLGAMSASIAHEINQPLAAIVTNSNAALRWLGHSTPDLDEARSALKRIVEDGHRASQVIASIRAAFKKDGGNKVWLPVADVIHDVLRLSRGNLLKQAVTLEIDLDDQLPHVLADRVQLQQVLLNLIVNASDAMASVTGRPRLLQVRSGVHDAGAIQVSVADSGTGIDEKDRSRIFDAFFTTKSAGMGMGLFICRSIIEAHGGRLWASPGDPNGTVFCLVLPTGKTDGL